MKAVTILLASILCAAAPGYPVENKKSSESVFPLGQNVVQSVRAEYTSGKYNDFLKDMDEDYKRARKANQLEGLIQIRQDTGKIQIDPEFAKSYGVIQKSKNQQLLSIAKGNAPFDQKIRSAAQSINELDPRLLSLNYKTPGTGKNSDENALIDISLEYYYKGTHLDSQASTKTISEQKQKHMALEMEKMEKMVAVSKHFTDKELRSAVQDAAAILDARMAKSYDTSDLLALGKGKVKPATSQEESAAAIVSSSQGELADLHRHLLNSVK